MEHSNHIKILYGLVLVLLLGMVAMASLWYQSQKGRSVNQMPLPAAIASTTNPDLSGVVIGGTAGPQGTTLAGNITELVSGSMTIKNVNQNLDKILIGTDTKFQIVGADKDPVTLQKEFAAYNAQVAELMKDPVKNKAALAAARPPTLQTVTDATLADFKVGDHVYVTTSGADSSGAYTAIGISKNTQ